MASDAVRISDGWPSRLMHSELLSPIDHRAGARESSRPGLSSISNSAVMRSHNLDRVLSREGCGAEAAVSDSGTRDQGRCGQPVP